MDLSSRMPWMLLIVRMRSWYAALVWGAVDSVVLMFVVAVMMMKLDAARACGALAADRLRRYRRWRVMPRSGRWYGGGCGSRLR